MRAIIPVYDEYANVSIKNKKELLDLIKEKNFNDFILTKMIASGDIERLLFGYADDELLKKIKEEKEKIINNKKRGFSLPGYLDLTEYEFLLIAGSYHSKTNSIINDTIIHGYHRQKTRFFVDDKFKIKNGQTTISNLLFKKNTSGNVVCIYIEKDTFLNLTNVIFDGITLVVEDGASLKMENVFFRGGQIGVIQKGDSLIESKNVNFIGISYEYYFENLSKETSKGILNFHNRDEIIDFIRKSKVDNLFMYENIDFSEKELIPIKTKINIESGKNDNSLIFLKFNKILLSSKLHSGKNIIIEGEIYIKDSVNVDLNLNILFGSIDIIDSKEVVIATNRIIPFNKKVCLNVENSNILIMDTSIGEKEYISEISIEMSSSIIHFKNTAIEYFESAIKKKKKNIENGEIKLYEEQENEIFFEDLKISNCNEALKAEGSLKKIIGTNLLLENLFKGMSIKKALINIKEFIIKDIKKSPFSFHNSKIFLSGENSLVTRIGNAVEIEDNSECEMENIKWVNIKESAAISINNSTLISHHSIFQETLVAIHTFENGLFVNDDNKFEDVNTPILKEHGSKPQMDYVEYLAEKEIKNEGM